MFRRWRQWWVEGYIGLIGGVGEWFDGWVGPVV